MQYTINMVQTSSYDICICMMCPRCLKCKLAWGWTFHTCMERVWKLAVLDLPRGRERKKGITSRLLALHLLTGLWLYEIKNTSKEWFLDVSDSSIVPSWMGAWRGEPRTIWHKKRMWYHYTVCPLRSKGEISGQLLSSDRRPQKADVRCVSSSGRRLGAVPHLRPQSSGDSFGQHQHDGKGSSFWTSRILRGAIPDVEIKKLVCGAKYLMVVLWSLRWWFLEWFWMMIGWAPGGNVVSWWFLLQL